MTRELYILTGQSNAVGNGATMIDRLLHDSDA